MRGAQKLGFAEMERRVAEMGAKAREGTLRASDMAGGTFTISNGGVVGSMVSQPLINPPQAAILGVHAIVRRPVCVPPGSDGDGGPAPEPGGRIIRGPIPRILLDADEPFFEAGARPSPGAGRLAAGPGPPASDRARPPVRLPRQPVQKAATAALDPGDVAIEARPMMWLSLTHDRRLVDERTAAAFLRSVALGVEDPRRLLIGA